MAVSDSAGFPGFLERESHALRHCVTVFFISLFLQRERGCYVNIRSRNTMKKVKKRRDGDEGNAKVTCGCVKRENVELWAWMDLGHGK